MRWTQEGLNGFYYVTRGKFVGANGEEIPGYAAYDQWEIAADAKPRVRPPAEGLGELHQATTITGKPLIASMLDPAFYPYDFRPDNPT